MARNSNPLVPNETPNSRGVVKITHLYNVITESQYSSFELYQNIVKSLIVYKKYKIGSKYLY